MSAQSRLSGALERLERLQRIGECAGSIAYEWGQLGNSAAAAEARSMESLADNLAAEINRYLPGLKLEARREAAKEMDYQNREYEEGV